jgi:A/G-specific DNA glycosylase
MELGALVCTQRSPRCPHCPLAGECRWFAAGRPPAEVRPRGQSWAGTDRQARGRVMALLREAHTAQRDVPRDEALEAATLPGAEGAQAGRVLDALLADGLVAVDPAGGGLRLPH